MAYKVLISVTSDLVTDQRVNRLACTFKDLGYNVLVIGRKLRKSSDLPQKRFRSVRFRLLFEKGPLFYIYFNLKLFHFLLVNEAHLLYSNDLDTLLPNYLASRIKKIPLIYDSHEYFTGVPELENRPVVKGIWKWIEKRIIPKLNNAITVNDSIADLYLKEYGTPFAVIRNVPMMLMEPVNDDRAALRVQLGLPANQSILIMQGAGINIQRGAEEAVQSMKFLDEVLLLIIGGGDVIPQLKADVKKENLTGKVIFIDKLPIKELHKYTKAADIGLSLDKDTNLNYKFSLPNKLFDYIQAGIPVLVSDLPEVRKIVEEYKVGRISPDHNPENLAKMIQAMLNDTEQKLLWEKNARAATLELNWEKEQRKLIDIIKKIV
jgi:glycosyltransferase involved in cell wall biosynthesis